jgi:hypothetical protein
MTSISTRHNGQELVYFRDRDRKWVWDQYPVAFDDIEQRTVKVHLGLAILRQETRMPTAMAGFAPQQVRGQFLQALDMKHQRKVLKYEVLLEQATKEDVEAVRTYEKVYKVKEKYGPLWPLMKAFGHRFQSRQEREFQAQCNRKGWFHYVKNKESARAGKLERLFTRTLATFITRLRAAPQNQALQMEAWQIVRVFRTLYPDVPNEKADAALSLVPDDATMWERL